MENQNAIYLYNDEIDLKAYVKTVLDFWVWILFASLITGIVTFFYISTQEEIYVARSLISISAPQLDVEFDTNIRTTDVSIDNLQNNDLSALALSDKVIVALFSQVKSELPGDIQNHDKLKDHLTAASEDKSEIIALSGGFNDPELSSFVVNTWGQLFVEAANLFFEGPQKDSQRFLNAQLLNVRLERAQINEELVKFQSQNRTVFIQAQLDADRNLQQTYINKRNALDVLLYDIQGIKKQVEQNSTDANVLSDLTLYALQSRAFGTAGSVQIDITSFESLSSTDLDSRLSLFASLELTIVSQKTEIEGLILKLEPLILFRQQQIQELINQEAELESRRALSQNTLDSLAIKAAEAEIEQNDTSGQAQIASIAVVPVEPESRNRIANVALSTLVAAMFSIGVVLIRAWWLDEDQDLNAINMRDMNQQTAVSYTNGNEGLPIHGNGNGNGIHPTEKEEFPAND